MARQLEVDIRALDLWPETSHSLVSTAALHAFLALAEPAGPPCEVSVFLADDETVRELNKTWRGIDKPTNVLSFPSDMPDSDGQAEPNTGDGSVIHLGDIALALETLRREAVEQDKEFDDHLSHLVVHGVLHLFGLDHIEPTEADEMEQLETEILSDLGIADPYMLSDPL